MDLKLNDKPDLGLCSISPSNGTLRTLFTINCSNWFDSDGVRSYSVSGWWNNAADRTFLSVSDQSTIDLYLPANDLPVNLLVSIRDRYDAVTEVPLPPVFVSTDGSSLNETFEFLTTGNLNRIYQTIFSLAERMSSNCKSIDLSLLRQSARFRSEHEHHAAALVDSERHDETVDLSRRSESSRLSA